MENLVVIGNGMVGYKFCEKLVAKNESNQFRITVFGEEPRPAYDRVHLSEYFSDKNAERLSMAPRSWYEENNIELITNERITDINRESKEITSITNKKYSYDHLVLATGSSCFVPPIPGVEKDGVFVYRTIEDLDATMNYVAKIKADGIPKKAAILGGGLLGLEAAKALVDMGLETSVVEFAPRLMPRQLNDDASKSLQTKLEDLGINILLSKATQEITGEGKIEGMHFTNDDSSTPFDMLLISAGIRPRDELAKTCGLEVGTRGGIVVGNDMKTSDPSIFAIGECALLNQMIYGLVAPGYDMAGVVVEQLIGNSETSMPTYIDMSTKLKLSGIDVASFGNALNDDKEGDEIVYENAVDGIYKSVIISKDKKSLLGGIMVGDAEDYSILHQIYLNGMKIPENPEDLILGARGGDGGALGSALDLPDSAIICSCENVSKGAICNLVQDETCSDVSEVSACTKAGTGCGGCKPMLKDLVTETLKSMGKVVKDVICEHFDYSRQELYGILKVKKVRSFNEALEACGNGHGCEVCKPVVSSIFASLYNDTPNKEEVTQDSNDRFLANIQRNGTYSVVPRIAGGEITPDKLVILGEIGVKYNLYTKITGGARIDFFGAELNDLPAIWKELIDAGFESGHAYGKSLRTVKSCVGSTWCRYGMDESISFAIELENRYKGLRSPHKIKGGVSGCIRECAEARGKDFGVIAVEGGWNLYVCGNGGATPRHAELLAEQIDNETVIKYLDRFLIYYIQTAAPLMRTAAWLDKLDGGIEQLKKIVVEDSLGLSEELEAQMDSLVAAYECEWKQAVENEETQSRFKHFVNSDDRDDNIVFVPLRDQKMPELWNA
ncbi:MAG: nitrite reductase large subunit NirB [Cyclobacteriaceae bacterium]